MASSPNVGMLRVSTFNASPNRATEARLIRDFSTSNNAQARTVPEIIQRNNADVVLVNEFDFDRAGPNGTSLAADLFRANDLTVGQNGAAPVVPPLRLHCPLQHGRFIGLRPQQNGAAVSSVKESRHPALLPSAARSGKASLIHQDGPHDARAGSLAVVPSRRTALNHR